MAQLARQLDTQHSGGAYLNLLAQGGQLGHMSLGLRADVADQSLGVALQLADALVAQLDLLLQVAVLQLERRELAQQLSMHGHQLLESLLQRLEVRLVALQERIVDVAVVQSRHRIVLDLQLHHLREGHSQSARTPQEK